MKNQNFVFFGSSQFSIYVLDELEKAGFVPSCIVTTPDKPAGRKLVMTPTPVALWALERNIKTLKPAKLVADEILAETSATSEAAATPVVFIVASYGKIIPQSVLEIPRRGTLNVHPSLLPKYRGATPLQSAILADDRNIGVTIIQLDAAVDHGPIVAQYQVPLDTFTTPATPGASFEWPPYEKFEEIMGHEGGRLLAQNLEPWINEKICANDQDHSLATFTKKIEKEDAFLSEDELQNALTGADPVAVYLTFRKIQAYHGSPSAYFFKTSATDKKRVKITAASFHDGKLVIERIIPEGKQEMPYSA